MTLPKVLILAVCSAVITAVFLTVPIFKGTSFERMGTYLEAWIFLAVIIMPNCKSALDSAIKTFLFFLVSQPLIYLFQVPFSDMGWKLFGYYRTWFIWTLLTFPMAFAGWYIKKRNWLSTVIITPAAAFLAVIGACSLYETVTEPPRLLVTGVLCTAHSVIYIYTFAGSRAQKLTASAVCIAAAICGVILLQNVDISGDSILPEGYSYSENAEITVDDTDLAQITFKDAENGILHVEAKKHGETTFTIKDGGKEQRFAIKIKKEDGHTQLEIEPLQTYIYQQKEEIKMQKEISRRKMMIQFVLLVLEALLMWSFLRALPVVCAGNIAGIGASIVLMAITIFFDKFRALISHLCKSSGGKAFVITISVLTVLGIIYCAVVSVLMARAISRGEDTKPQAVIVLGCQIRGDRPSRMLRHRLDKAAEILKDNPEAICIVSGGQGSDEQYTEAEIMEKYLTENGIDKSRITQEGNSATTKENMENSKAILDDMGMTGNICFVSDGYHLFRAGLIASDCGLDAYGTAAPTESRFVTTYWVREWLSVGYYLLRR